MSIRRVVGQPQITSDDLVFTHLGRTFGIEITELPELNFITLFEKINGEWTYPVQRPELAVNINLDYINNAAIKAAGGPMNWIKTIFVPWLNTLLKSIFPGGTVTMSEIEQVDKLLTEVIVIRSQADGTVVASLK